MDRVPVPVLAPEATARLAESLRAPGAFALDAATGVLLGPADASAPHPAARGALLAFARDARGAGATLLDLALGGPGVAATPSACRLLMLDAEQRAIVVVPIDGGARVRAQTEHAAGAPAPDESGAPLARILWQCDADGAVTHVGDRLRKLVGAEAGAIVGRRWRDLIGDLFLDPAGGLEAALSRRETASNIELLWARDHGAGPLTVQWSGLPVFDGARRFRGFRGFLLAPDEALPDAAPAPVNAASPARVDAAPPVETPPAPPPFESPPQPAPQTAAPVVATAGATPPAAEHPPRPATALPPMPHLSPAERNAFREIARALGVRPADEPAKAKAAEAAAASPAVAPQTPGIQADAPPSAEESAYAEAAVAASAAPDDGGRPDALADDLGLTSDEARQVAEALEEFAPHEDATTPAAAADEAESIDAVAERAQTADADDAAVPAAESDASDDAVDDAPHEALEDRVALDASHDEQPASAVEAESPVVANADVTDDAAGPALDDSAPPASVGADPTFAVEPALDVADPAPADAPLDESQAAAAVDDEPMSTVVPFAPLVASAPMEQAAAEPAAPDPTLTHARDVLDRLPVGVLVNRGDRALFANRTLLDLLDYPSLESVAAHGGAPALFKGRAPLSDRDGPTGPVLLNARQGEPVAVDARLQGIVWDGAPATLVTFRRAIDVEVSQKLKAAELDLRAREGELRETRAVLDTATDGVAVIDEDGRIMTLNRTAEALFGYDQNEVAGESISILFAPESHAQSADYFEGLKSGGVRSVLNDGRELIGRVRQGGRIPLFVTLGQISDRPSRKFCAVLRDLSSWKKTERDLVDARKSAEDASSQKSDFLAKISHEIRTPLNAIIGFAEVMMEERFGPVGNERYKDYLRDIHASGGHVISLVNDLLDLSKIEAGKLELTFASVNANEIVRGAVSLMQPQSQRARVVVRSALASKLPAVVADERALKQIVINLLSNAVKFTDSGGQVIISTTLTDLGEIAIRIRDTGIGMTDKELSEAMEPFRQLATSRRAGGTGLGLPLTKALVEANRAALKVSSVKNEGTLAEIVFPPTRVLAE